MPTTQEIYDSMIAEKESGNYPELDTLDSTSKVAVWRLMLWIFAFFSKTIHEVWDSFRAEINRIFAIEQVGTVEWWIDRIGKFQYQDELQFADGIFKYPTIDETKQIVKRTALETRQFVLFFKVAKDDGSGNLSPLLNDEKTALQAYINKLKMPGTYTSVVSEDADNVKVSLRVYYNAEVPKAEITTNIGTVIEDYIQNIVFNGKFVITDMIDQVQAVRGVVNPVALLVESKPASAPNYNTVTDYFVPAAGYSELTDLTIEFIPNV